MEPEQIRLFIAAELPESLNRLLSDYAAGYAAPHIKPVPAANLHLTLLFLGNTNRGNLADIKNTLAEVACTQKSFWLNLAAIEPGPKPSHPRLIWARFHPEQQFTQLCTRLQQLLLPDAKFPDQYLPHITLARISKDNRQQLWLPHIMPADEVRFQVKTIALWESKLASPHPYYSVLQSYSLLPA